MPFSLLCTHPKCRDEDFGNTEVLGPLCILYMFATPTLSIRDKTLFVALRLSLNCAGGLALLDVGGALNFSLPLITGLLLVVTGSDCAPGMLTSPLTLPDIDMGN